MARKYPGILERLADGALTLTAVRLLGPHLTADNCERVLGLAKHAKKRNIEELIASLKPKPDVPSVIRKLLQTPAAAAAIAPTSVEPHVRPSEPTNCSPAPMAAVVARAVVQPLAPERYKLQLTIAKKTHDTLRQLQDLLRHSIPDGDVSRIVDRALTQLLENVLRQKCAATKSPRVGAGESSDSRAIPAAVRRAVWARDGGRCAFVGTHGRCTETAFLEYHHCQPYAAGGKATVENIELRCRAHNAYEAELFFSCDVVRESDGDSFWNELPPLTGDILTRLRDAANLRTPG
jgi:5-methylcytosine-specific restriction endonuclease McrA